MEVDGKRYLAGYRLKLDALPKDADGKITYGITKAGGDSKFQRLENPYQSENLYLTAPDEYLILQQLHSQKQMQNTERPTTAATMTLRMLQTRQTGTAV